MTTETTEKGKGEAQKLWRHVFGSERGILGLCVWERAEDGTTVHGSVRECFFDYPRQAEQAERWALEQSDAGRETYYCAHLLTARRRLKENASEMLALYADLDGARIPNGGLKPTAVVETSPGRYHVSYRLSDAIPPEAAESINRRLARTIGADESGFDRSQLLRVPGTLNRKYRDEHTVRIVGLRSDQVYVPAEIEAALLEDGHSDTRLVAKPIGETIPNGNRNGTLASLAGTMRRRGMGEAEILAALEVTNRLRCKPPLTAEEVRRIVQSVARYEPASTPWWVKAVSKNA
jgi:hypothetical protein